jgi:hypothetical protein
MADPERPLPLATVIWFGSLEFMSLSYGYDMVLLPPRHPTDGDHELSQLGGALRRYHRSRRARAARRRRAQRSHHHRLAGGDGVPRSGAPQLDADTDFLAEDLCRMSLDEGKMPTGHPITPPSACGATSNRFRIDCSDTRDDASMGIPVWAEHDCLGICFLYKYQHERLRGAPRAPSTFCP